jgi:methyltransferase (TIGR00027 family)
MENPTASRTALATSLMRAAHTRLDPNPLIEDLWGDRLVPEAERELLRRAALSRLQGDALRKALESPGSAFDRAMLQNRSYPNVVTRTRYAEDALKNAVDAGAEQYVLIGAGFDSFALRRPSFADALQIFEIDFPATQFLKIERIASCAVSVADSVHFIAADLSQVSVAAALATSSFDPEKLTFFSWLGVTMYLTREANVATLTSLASCSPAGSEVVFTYLDEALFQTLPESFVELQARVASIGEPFLSGFNPISLAASLAGCGLTLIEDLDGEAITRRYDEDGSRRLRQSAFSHIALARVASRP